jgi:DNA-binding HxlR family transcriptional regulator
MAVEIKYCPVKVVMSYLGKRWTIDLIRDLMLGNKKFKDFLQLNKGLSNKVLSQRLKELEYADLIEKRIISKKPLEIEYVLTEKGFRLNQVLYELAQFSFEYHKKQIFANEPLEKEEYISLSRKMFLIDS